MLVAGAEQEPDEQGQSIAIAYRERKTDVELNGSADMKEESVER